MRPSASNLEVPSALTLSLSLCNQVIVRQLMHSPSVKRQSAVEHFSFESFKHRTQISQRIESYKRITQIARSPVKDQACARFIYKLKVVLFLQFGFFFNSGIKPMLFSYSMTSYRRNPCISLVFLLVLHKFWRFKKILSVSFLRASSLPIGFLSFKRTNPSDS